MAGVVARVTGVLEKVSTWALDRHRPHVAGFADTLRCSLQDRRITVVYWDGQDWCYRWRGGVLFYPIPSSSSRSLVEENWGLFTYGGVPAEGQTVVDVGAGIGTEIAAYCRAVGDSGTVVAIEADPESVRRLRKLVDRLGLLQVRVVHAAVSDRSGYTALARQAIDGVASTIVESGRLHESVVVPQTTIPEVLGQLRISHVDYLKMNIEGAERLALIGTDGAERVVSRWCVSCHDFLGQPETSTIDFVVSWFRSNGFEPYRHPSVADRPWAGYYVFAHPREVE